MRLLLDRLFLSVALSHFAVDLLNGQRSVLFTYLGEPLGISNFVLGFFTTLYIIGGALLQPLFGYLADRVGPRWPVAGGVFWLALFFSLAMVIPPQIAMWVLVLASLGSASFHPAGTMEATLRGRDQYSGKETTAASYFFLFGQVGLFLGPLLAGLILSRTGELGLLSLTGLAFLIGIFAARQLRATSAAAPDAAVDQGDRPRKSIGALRGGIVLPLIAFAVMAALQSWAQQNMMTFVPKYLSDLGQTVATYGLIAALFMGGSALGNVAGGSMADRYGKRRVASIALALASIPLFGVSQVGWSSWLYVLIPLAGALTGATHSIIVVLAQRIIPAGMGTASGMILGYLFVSGALGALLSGYLADLFGITMVFQLSAVIVLIAAGLALTLPKT